MEFVIEKDISEDTIFQVYQIALDDTRDYFTRNYPEALRADMRFQRAITLRTGAEVTSAIVFTCLDGSPHIPMMATKVVLQCRAFSVSIWRTSQLERSEIQ